MCRTNMRQKFDIGDLVVVQLPTSPGIRRLAGVIIETRLINRNTPLRENLAIDWTWHHDEYSCKIRFFDSPETKWVRARMLSHLSKIKE